MKYKGIVVDYYTKNGVVFQDSSVQYSFPSQEEEVSKILNNCIGAVKQALNPNSSGYTSLRDARVKTDSINSIRTRLVDIEKVR